LVTDVQPNSALVLFSGGQDSTTCLAWALNEFSYVETIGFDYGQRHAIELQCRQSVLTGLGSTFANWAVKLGEDLLLDATVLAGVSDTALTNDREIEFAADGLPNTFVPGRNLLFLTLAAAVAYRRGLRHLIIGVCETDYSGYPDCRDDTIKAMQLALNLGMANRFIIHTPLMWRDKAQTWKLAEELGGFPLVKLIRDESHTCYLGSRDEAHDWGRGCGSCPACKLRAAGWNAYLGSSTETLAS
jgi:7-cyano-7-deazaguanine synthase